MTDSYRSGYEGWSREVQGEMKIGFYSPVFNAIKMGFDYRGALDNWAVYADTISVAINLPAGETDDGTYVAIRDYAAARGYPLSIIQTDFSYDDSFMYGKIVNAALQNCKADVLIEQDLDERFMVDKGKLKLLGGVLQADPNIKAFFIPTVDLYGSHERCLFPPHCKWYYHVPGLYRGAVNFGIKTDGRPDYNKTSTDELIDANGNLVPTARLLDDLSIEGLRRYVSWGMPISFHLGYVSFNERLDRSLWWKRFWEKASGDPNQHPTSVAEMAAKQTIEHKLPMWPSIQPQTEK